MSEYLTPEMKESRKIESSRDMFLFSSNIGLNPHGGPLYQPSFLKYTRLDMELYDTNVIPMSTSAQYGMFKVIKKNEISETHTDYLLRIAFARIDDDVIRFMVMSNHPLLHNHSDYDYRITLPSNDLSNLSLGNFYPLLATSTMYNNTQGYMPISFRRLTSLIEYFHGHSSIGYERERVIVDTLMNLTSNIQPFWRKIALSLSPCC